MAVQNNVLYVVRLYGTTTYATNEDPESSLLSLSDDTSLTDTDFRFLADALAALDVVITADAIKALAESISTTEEALFVAAKTLVDAIMAEDAPLAFERVKGLSEFIRVKDWVELKVQRTGIWSVSPAFGTVSSDIHLYGPGVYYGVDYYAANPRVNWLLSTPNTATWQMTEAATQGITLYAETLYSQFLYGSVPAVGWTKPIPTGQQAWTNSNGESHN